jgi:hypothetical protein
MAVPIANTLAFLLGSWSIERLIHDHRDGSEATFTGVAVVTPAAQGASYHEAGQLTRGTHTGPARRTLAFRELTGTGTGVAIDFPDGRPFVALDLAAGRWEATHPCRADTYELSFEALDLDRIHETWRVMGPAKDYGAETVWRRR